MAVLILLSAVQLAILPRTVILVVLFVAAFVWIASLLMLVMAAKLNCLKVDVTKHFLMRLVMMVFTIVIIYSVAQVNVFSCLEQTKQCPNMTITTIHMDLGSVEVLDDHRQCPLPQYIVMSCIMSFLPIVVFLRLPVLLKGALIVPMAVVFLIVIELTHGNLFTCYDMLTDAIVPLHVVGAIAITSFAAAVLIHGRQVEWTARLDFLWNAQANEEKLDMHELQNSNRRILFNLLPAHVATHFLDNQFRSHMDLYHQSYSKVGVMFATIPNFHEFYMELDGNNQGVECLRLLNEIIADFDEVIQTIVRGVSHWLRNLI